MKKHIIGLVFFSFIVGAAAIVYAALNFFNLPNIPTPEYNDITVYNFPILLEKPAKVGKIDSNSPIIKQAVFNSESKMLYLDLYNSDGSRYDAKLPLMFSFFRKDAKEIRIIATEKYYLNSDYVRYNGTTIKEPISVSYDWLDTLNSYDNIYVIAEADSEYHNQKATSVFDSRFAQAVTIYTNKKASTK